uniref:Sushi domain-containing protein n=1 Tax=Amphilophus citrinellus TaxID=61819 RepID=A0A3Q0T1Z0_AMPCI
SQLYQILHPPATACILSVKVLPVDYEIEYICRGSRVMVGPKVRKCLPNGTWTDLSQPSRCLLSCPRLWTLLENGRVSSWSLGPPVEGTVLHYICLPGFILMGQNSAHCNRMGKWDTPKPVCHCETPDRNEHNFSFYCWNTRQNDQRAHIRRKTSTYNVTEN